MPQKYAPSVAYKAYYGIRQGAAQIGGSFYIAMTSGSAGFYEYWPGFEEDSGWGFKVFFSSLLSRLSGHHMNHNKRVGYGGTFKVHTHTSRMRIIRRNSQRNSRKIAAGILRWLDLGLISGNHFCLHAKHDRKRSCSPINRGTQIHNTVIMMQVSVSYESKLVLSAQCCQCQRWCSSGVQLVAQRVASRKIVSWLAERQVSRCSLVSGADPAFVRYLFRWIAWMVTMTVEMMKKPKFQ